MDKKTKVLYDNIKKKKVELKLGVAGESLKGTRDKCSKIIQLADVNSFGVLKQRHMEHLYNYNKLIISPGRNPMNYTPLQEALKRQGSQEKAETLVPNQFSSVQRLRDG